MVCLSFFMSIFLAVFAYWMSILFTWNPKLGRVRRVVITQDKSTTLPFKVLLFHITCRRALFKMNKSTWTMGKSQEDLQPIIKSRYISPFPNLALSDTSGEFGETQFWDCAFQTNTRLLRLSYHIGFTVGGDVEPFDLSTKFSILVLSTCRMGCHFKYPILTHKVQRAVLIITVIILDRKKGGGN